MRQEREALTAEEQALRVRFPRDQHPGFAFSYERGHLVYHLSRSDPGKYADTDEPIDRSNPRPCKACGRLQTGKVPPCMGILPGVKYAYCGNGRNTGYVMFENGFILKGFQSPPEGHHKTFKTPKPVQTSLLFKD